MRLCHKLRRISIARPLGIHRAKTIVAASAYKLIRHNVLELDFKIATSSLTACVSVSRNYYGPILTVNMSIKHSKTLFSEVFFGQNRSIRKLFHLKAVNPSLGHPVYDEQ